MAENINALILPIGADATQFERSINDVKSAFKELSATIAATPFNLVTDKQKLQLNALKETLTILTTDVKTFGQAVKIPENSILGLTQRIAELNKKKISLDAKTSASEIARLTKEIEKLTTQKNNIDALGRSVSQIGTVSQSSFTKVQDSSKGARTALTSLSLVAQDAPFGFIAIQNNLPALIQTFGELTRTSKGVQSAFSQIGSALAGPAGLFLGFSLLTAGITVLVQKYGTLGNAIDAIIGGNQKLSLDIAKLNKEYGEYSKNIDNVELSLRKSQAAESGKLQSLKILTETVTDLSKSESVRSNALNQLKEFDKDYYDQFTTSTLNADKLREATDKLTDSIIAQAQARGLESRISKITEQIEELTFAQEQLAPEFSKTSKKLTNSLDEVSRATFQPGGVGLGFISDLFQLNQVTNQLSEGDKNIELERQRLDKTKERLEQTLSEIVSLPKKSSETKGKIPGLREIIEGTQGEGIITTNLALFEKYIQAQVRINNAGVDKMVRYRREQLNALDLMPTKLEKDIPTLGIGLPFGPEALKNLQEYYNLLLEIQDIDQDIINILTKGLGVENIYEKAIKDLLNFEAYQKAASDRISRNFRFLQNPLENLFGTVLEDGIANWQAFGDAVVSEIKKIAAALLAKSFITLLGNLLAPGVGSILGGAFSGISTDGLGDWLDIFDPQGSKVNFAGVQGGGMQMAGAVNLTLRGSDLVGSINRTNSTINRVG
jgi:predicted  nucleic acid-binding Zn-ribbon protein